ncbi:MAG TPA: phage tail protein [Kofleriaceae bacterium]|jgi:phage tail-like protein|nr:phage tail protein [Kofleriaceae bacterium]
MADERRDPLPVFCFQVQIAGIEGAAFFKSVSGIKYELETIPVREGGNNATTFQLIGAAKWSNIILKSGYVAASSKNGLLAWRNEWLHKRGGRRLDGQVTILDTALKAQTSWKWTRGIPVKWEISELDASKSELAIETIEIAHEGLTIG